DYDDSSWKTPRAIQTGAPFGATGYGDEQWELVPRSIPLMERTYQKLSSLRSINGVLTINGTQLENRLPMTIPAGEKATLLMDQQELTTAFPELVVSKGQGRSIKATYAEALFNDIQNKGNRDSIAGKKMQGVFDVFIPDGGDHRIF